MKKLSENVPLMISVLSLCVSLVAVGLLTTKSNDPWRDYAVALQVVDSERNLLDAMNSLATNEEGKDQYQRQFERLQLAKEHMYQVRVVLPKTLPNNEPFKQAPR